MTKKCFWLCLCFFALALLLNSVFSSLCLEYVPEQGASLIPGVVSLEKVTNTGAAFSFLNGRPGLVAALSAVLLGALGLFMGLAEMKDGARAALYAAFAGGLINLLSRLRDGCVTDWIRLEFMSFPVFNFADICVVLGCLVFAVIYLFTGDRKRKAGEDKADAV